MKSTILLAAGVLFATAANQSFGAIEAYSNINLFNFAVYNNAGGGTPGTILTNGTGGLSVLGPGFQSSADGDVTSIAGGPVATSKNLPNPGGLNTLQAFEGSGPAPAENFFGNFGGSIPFGRGDTNGSGAIIAGLGFSTPASVQLVADTELPTGPGIADGAVANSSVKSTASFTLSVTTSLDAVFNLDISRNLTAGLIPFPPGSSAAADTSFNITIKNAAGLTVFNWAPDGILGTIGGATAIEYADPFDANGSVTAFPGTTISDIDPLANFRAGVSLGAGQYSVTIQTQTGAAVNRTDLVPEPGSIAVWSLLVGVGGAMTALRVKRKS